MNRIVRSGGWWLAAALLIAVSGVHAADVIINEIHYNPDIKVEPVEFVELYNAGTNQVNLSGWHFSRGMEYIFPPSTFLGAGQYVVVAQDPAALNSKFAASSHGPYGGSLGNEGDRIVLCNAVGATIDAVEYQLGFPWPTCGDIPGYSAQLLNPELDNDLGGSWRSGTPTPGLANGVFSATNSIPPQARQVEHVPKQPKSGESVLITAKVTDPDGVAAVTLHYQIVEPGNYVAVTDTVYEINWTDLSMNDDGTGGDVMAGDTVYSVQVAPSHQVHRRLIRYRISVEDTLANAVRVPYADDPQPNFAYFVYDGVPSWTGAAQPGVTTNVVYGTNIMQSLPVYHFIVKTNDLWKCTWPISSEQYWGVEYPWSGTLVYDGEVYDHISFRARGGVWRYAMGKNMWKFDFKRGHYFRARDNRGNRYDTDWDKLNFSACIQQGDLQHRGEQGMFEAVGFRLFELAGVPASKTHWLQFRIIDEAAETGATQFDDDFWGLYLAIEQMDGKFLNEHNLPDGNLYKMEGGTGELNNQGPMGPVDKSDLNTFMSQYSTTPSETWWRQNVDVDCYYSYRTIIEAIHHYDIGSGKNYFYYLNPVPVINEFGTNNLWSQWPWDLDLAWADNMWDGGNQGLSPFKQYGLLAQPNLSIEYKNRIREIRDLLFNTNQAWQLIEDLAAVIDDPSGDPSIVDADRASWDYRPIMIDYARVNVGKAGHGKFYQQAVSKDFPGMLQIMKDYVVTRGTTILDPACADADIPSTPSIWSTAPTNLPIDSITLECSSFSDPQGGTFGGMKWRVGEITDTNSPAYTPDARKKYEIEAVWEYELPYYTNAVLVPPASLRVGHTYRARVRMKDNTGRWSHWSPPCVFTPGERDNAANLIDFLRITEIMYNPPSGNDMEFVELHNTSGAISLDIDGVSFTAGIDYAFTNNTSIPPGGYLIVAGASASNNFELFRTYYGLGPVVPVVGPFDGKLANGGEQLNMKTATAGTMLFSARYDSARGWPVAADGAGHSLVPLVTDCQTNGILDYCGNWRASTYMDGSPGEADPDPLITVVLNELGAHTDTELPFPNDSDDSIELYNCEVGDRSLADWYLSDDPSDLTKWQIPMTRVITGRTWMTFTENTGFHTNRLDGSGFGLNKDGEQVYLSYLPGTAEDRVADCVRFKGQENGVSLGRYVDGSGYWYDGLTVTTNAANAAPSNHVVISEIMYDPASTSEPNDTVEEFIELHNRTMQQVDLWNGSGTWRLDGLGYTFPTNTSIPAGGYLVVVPFDPETNAAALNEFLSAYGLVEGQIRIFGPYSGKLSNRGERMALERPQEPDWPSTDISWVIVDEVIYFNQSPWPTEPNGTGKSLQRIPGSGHGCDPNSWRGTIDPTPGMVGGTKVVLSSPFSGSEFLLPFSAEVKAEIDPFQTSGLVQWVQFYLDTSCIYTDTVPPYEFTLSTITTAGIYVLTAQVKDSAPGVSTSQPSVITVYGPLSVNNDIGATDVTEFTAQLHGSFSGTATADCYFYWGGTDGGSNSGAWANEVRVGIMPSGTFLADIGISGLDPGDDRYYRACVKKAGGEKWADSSASFQPVELSEWPRKAKITFAGYDRPETLNDFPAVIAFGTNISGFTWDELGSAQGYDLRFSDEDGATMLSYEMETWDTNTVSLIWVKVPALTGGGHIWAYWGKPSSVPPPYSTNGSTWRSDYSAVWHLKDTGAQDSTDNGSDGVSYNISATAGKVGNGLLFNGVDSGVVVPMYQKDATRLTASAWVWDSGSPPGASIMVNEGSSVLGQFKLGLKMFRYGVIGTLTGQDDVQVSAVEIRGSNPQGSWEYVAMVCDGSMIRLYRNGLSVTDVPYVPPLKTSFGPLGIGVRTDNSGVPETTNRWNGIMDEVRISTTGRSSNWIWACWLNQSAGAGFCDYGSAEDNEGIVDLDNDQMADEWEVSYFGSTNAVSGGPYEDKDGDGQVNLHEYIAGTVPTNVESCLEVELILEAGEPVVRYYAIKATGTAYIGQSRWYDLEDTTNLPSGGWLGILGQTNIEAVSSEFRQYTNAVPVGSRFFRLKTRLK